MIWERQKLPLWEILLSRNTICFHGQQAVEKYLKGYLIYLDVSFRFSHDLTYLLSLINESEEIASSWYEKAAFLNSFAVSIRYPVHPEPEIQTQDLQKVLDYALAFREWLVEKMDIEIEEHF